MIKIWDKYIIKKFIFVFCLLLFGFYGIFILLDFATHSSYFPHTMQDRFLNIVYFYLCEFSNRIEALIPFALIITTIKVLSDLNMHNEIVAMLASGISLKRLLRPFFMLCLFFIGILYLNSEFFLPLSQTKIKFFTEERRRLKKSNFDHPYAHHLILNDNSLLLYQNFDVQKQYFYDAFWVKSINDIYRIKYLYPNETPPRAIEIEHLTRNYNNQLTISEFKDSQEMNEMIFNKKRLLETTLLLEEFKLSQLWKNISWNLSNFFPNWEPIMGSMSEKQTKLLTLFYIKIAMPWLCFIAIILPIPFCLKFSRNFQVFIIYSIFTFGLVAFYLIIESLEIMSKRQVIHPSWIIFFPAGLVFFPVIAYLSSKYLRSYK